ncbi:MAG TPA: hypothetical protein VK813_10060 [Edaphobacter sp.]|nr:hypothetical protein [Edaphobacter sp.]
MSQIEIEPTNNVFYTVPVRVIFSCENKIYMWWQAEFLHYTYLLAGMEAELTALVAETDEPELEFSCKTVRVANYKDSIPDVPLLSLNKSGGIAEWAALDGPRDETILIVDPDSMFVRPVIDPGPIKAGEAHSEEHDYMGVDIPGNRTVLDRHCREELRAKIQPVGIYIFINRGCLAELARRWLQKSIDIAADPVCREALGGTGWLSDMWGYAIAAAELGIHHHLRDFSQVTGSDSLANPITHYCFPLMEGRDEIWEPDTQRPILWSKWTYRPWDDPPDPFGTTIEGEMLLERLRDFVNAKRGEQINQQSM